MSDIDSLILRAMSDIESLALLRSRISRIVYNQEAAGLRWDDVDLLNRVLAQLGGDGRPKHMSPFEKAAAIERDRTWSEVKAGDPEWTEQRRADALLMAGYDRRGLLNELGWREVKP